MWQANKSVFTIALPKAKPPQQHTVLAGFANDFMNLFTASPIISSVDAATSNLPALDDHEDWADLDIESHHDPRPSTHNQSKHTVEKGDVDDPIPEISTLPRPEELTKRPPYWLLVKQESPTKVVVQGSHTPSLACLEGYLKRWCRGEASRANRVSIAIDDLCTKNMLILS
jgi:hypothetical protein